jgi:hypothetical protein
MMTMTFKVTNQHGLTRHFDDLASLNLKSRAPEGRASVCAARHFACDFGTDRTCRLLVPSTKKLHTADNLKRNLETLNC